MQIKLCVVVLTCDLKIFNHLDNKEIRNELEKSNPCYRTMKNQAEHKTSESFP